MIHMKCLELFSLKNAKSSIAVIIVALAGLGARSDERLTGDQEVTGSLLAVSGSILSWRLIMKYFLHSFSPFRWFKKGSCQFFCEIMRMSTG